MKIGIVGSRRRKDKERVITYVDSLENHDIVSLGKLVQEQVYKETIQKVCKPIKHKVKKSLPALCTSYLLWVLQGRTGELLRANIHREIANYLHLDGREPKLLNILHHLETVIQFDTTDVGIESKVKLKAKELAKLLESIK